MLAEPLSFRASSACSRLAIAISSNLEELGESGSKTITELDEMMALHAARLTQVHMITVAGSAQHAVMLISIVHA